MGERQDAMGERRDERRRRTRIGLALMAGIVVVSVVVFFLDAIERATSEGPRVRVLAAAAPGLEPGSTVWVAGRPVGRVLSVGFRPPGEVEGGVFIIEAVLERGIDPILRADASARIQSSGLLEPEIIAIDPGTTSAPRWNFADTLRTPTDYLTEEDLRAMADTLLEMRAGIAADVRALRERIRRGGGTLAALEANPEVLETAGERAERLRRLVEEELPEGTLARLARDTLIASRVGRIRGRLARFDSLTERRDAMHGLEASTRALDALRLRMTRISERLEAGEGTAGRALVDDEIARQMALLRARLDSLVVELVRHPSRWLRVRVF